MPSDLQRKPSKFICNGLDLVHPPDLIPEGYYPYLKNARSVVQGTVECRPGYSKVNSDAALNSGAPIHTIRRMNNLVPGATTENQLFLGSGTKLYAGAADASAATDFTAIATGFSGSPLSSVIFRPDQSPEPWMYVADANKMVKVDTAQTVRNIGIAPPTVPPTPEISATYSLTFMEGNSASGWIPDGTVVTAAPTSVSRTPASTTVGHILYDSGSSGYCCISPSTPTGNYAWLQPGCKVNLNSAEYVIVEEVHQQAGFPSTTGTVDTAGTAVTWVSGSNFASTLVGDPFIISGVSYIVAAVADSTNLTLATSAGVQAGATFSGSPGTTISSIIYDSGSTGLCSIVLTDPSPYLERNSILLLDFNDVVRVLSVTQGNDGLYSLRCSTSNNHVAGELVRSVVSFRCGTTTTISAGNTITAAALEFTLTTAGTGYIVGAQATNASSISNRPVTPDDYMHISIKVSDPSLVSVGRVSLNIDPNNSTAPFTRNYFYKEFRPNDLQGNADSVITATVAQQTAIQNQTVADQAPDNAANSIQLATGDGAWVELRFPISDLVRVGTNQNCSLATVTALMIQLTVTAAVTVDVSAWYETGTFGPDVIQGSPVGISYQYRYRDSRTGAKSLPSPVCRYELFPVRQQISVGVTASSDPQVDTVDVQRFDPNLASWVYVGSKSNTTGNFTDTTQASLIASNPAFETNVMQPWAVVDTPKTAVVNVAGTSVNRVSGDLFDTAWAPGTIIQIGDDTTQLYGQPAGVAFLQLTQNLGTKTNATLTIASPLKLGQPLPIMFGPLEGPTATYAFGIGDPLNPGTLYWTNGNDLDAADDSNTLELTSPSEPLVSGCVWQNLVYVASAKRVFLCTPSYSTDSKGAQTIIFTPTELTSISGSFSGWGMVKGPQGVYMVGRDGIYKLDYNSGEYYSQQIYPLFPHDGQPAATTNGFVPVDMSDAQRLRLSYCDADLLFDYNDTDGSPLTFEVDANGGFWPHEYPNPVITHYWEEVPESVEPRMLMGTSDGYLLASGGTSDAGTALTFTARTPSYDFGDPRPLKLFMDMMTDVDAAGGYALTVGFNNYSTTVSVGMQAAVSGRVQYLDSISSTAAAGLKLYRNIAAQYVCGAGTVLFEFEPSYYPQPFYSKLYTTQLMDHAIPGWKQLRYGRFAIISIGTVTIQILNDDGVELADFDLASTSGVLKNYFVQLPHAAKGRLLRYSASADSEFVLFVDKTFVRIKKWGREQFVEVPPFLA